VIKQISAIRFDGDLFEQVSCCLSSDDVTRLILFVFYFASSFSVHLMHYCFFVLLFSLFTLKLHAYLMCALIHDFQEPYRLKLRVMRHRLEQRLRDVNARLRELGKAGMHDEVRC
jgi:hypothetical protein